MLSTLESPFIVYALPRSRTAWLARFLSYGGWRCSHETAIFLRNLQDVRDVFALSRTGTVETAAAQAWRIIHHHVPTLRAVVIRRPVDEVVESVLAVDLMGVAKYDPVRVRAIMDYGDRCLDQIALQPGTLSISFEDLARPEACAAIFERCLGIPFNREWWAHLAPQKIEVNVPAMIAYYHNHFNDIHRFKSLMRAELSRLARAGAFQMQRAA